MKARTRVVVEENMNGVGRREPDRPQDHGWGKDRNVPSREVMQSVVISSPWAPAHLRKCQIRGLPRYSNNMGDRAGEAAWSSNHGCPM